MEWILLGALLILGLIATFFVMGRASKGYESAKARSEGSFPVRHCSTCKSRMEYAGLREFPEGMVLEMYECPTCRKAEFFLPPAALE